LHFGKFEKRRPTFFKLMSVYIKMTFTQLENHSQLLCGHYFANERLLVYQLIIAKRASDVITQTNSDKQTGMLKDLTLFQAPKQVFPNTTF